MASLSRISWYFSSSPRIYYRNLLSRLRETYGSHSCLKSVSPLAPQFCTRLNIILNSVFVMRLLKLHLTIHDAVEKCDVVAENSVGTNDILAL